MRASGALNNLPRNHSLPRVRLRCSRADDVVPGELAVTPPRTTVRGEGSRRSSLGIVARVRSTVRAEGPKFPGLLTVASVRCSNPDQASGHAVSPLSQPEPGISRS